MSKKKKQDETVAEGFVTAEENLEENREQTAEEKVQTAAEQAEVTALKEQMAQQEDKYLRLAAEYDNFRKRTQKEKESIWTDAKSATAASFLPVYDNLERALKQATADEAYKKGVEMTMTQLVGILNGLGVEIFGNVGDTFDPTLHNAVMHTEDENLGENTICQVFQKGFKIGDKIVRFAMVQVAN